MKSLGLTPKGTGYDTLLRKVSPRSVPLLQRTSPYRLGKAQAVGLRDFGRPKSLRVALLGAE